jgi:hypothetical protein
LERELIIGLCVSYFVVADFLAITILIAYGRTSLQTGPTNVGDLFRNTILLAAPATWVALAFLGMAKSVRRIATIPLDYAA